MTLIRNGAIFAAGLVLAFLASGPARAQLSTLDVATKTIVAVPQCASYRVGGACFFLKCGFFGCSVKTSVRVRHFAPDLVVSVYHDRATHPWDYGR
ncbi:MAG: TraU family protein, partial [Burkholderiales bacterium]|nr:TraU family protein [Burkholderiales bacterium]